MACPFYMPGKIFADRLPGRIRMRLVRLPPDHMLPAKLGGLNGRAAFRADKRAAYAEGEKACETAGVAPYPILRASRGELRPAPLFVIP